MSCKRIRPGDQAAEGVIAWQPNNGGPAPVVRVRKAEGASASMPQEVDARVQAAYQEGQRAAESAAKQREEHRLEPSIAALSVIIQELASLRKRLRTEAEGDMVKLAVAIARRVLHRELATDPEAILGVVIAAFHKLNARETQRLRMSTADAAVIHENRIRLELPPGLDVSADTSLGPGSVIFETSRGELDASVDTQLAEIERGFTDVLRRRSR